jgi:hypothetical protein
MARTLRLNRSAYSGLGRARQISELPTLQTGGDATTKKQSIADLRVREKTMR